MIAVRSRLPEAIDRPPIVLVHGAANSAAVWTLWQDRLAEAGWASHAVDLRGHGANPPLDLSHTTMADYTDDVRGFVAGLDAQPIVIGWSMGGLVAIMVAYTGDAAACVALKPSPPANEVDDAITLRSGTLDSTEYGIERRRTLRHSHQCLIWTLRRDESRCLPSGRSLGWHGTSAGGVLQ